MIMCGNVRTIIAAFWCLLTVCSANGQQTNVTGEFTNVTFPEFVKQVEKGTSCHFYYDEVELDSFVINTRIVDKALADALNQIFKSTPFHFSFDVFNNVFITKNSILQTTLSEDFFDPAKKIISKETDVAEDENVIKGKTRPSFTESKLFEIGSKSSVKKNSIILTGFVKDIKNGEALPGASLYIDSTYTGVVTDQFGYYSLTVKPGDHILEVTSLGMKETRRRLLIYGEGKLNIEMQDDIPTLKNVIVTSERRSNVRSTQMGIDRLSVKEIKDVPVIFGETDILRVVLTLPGVTSVGEASTGFNVRGGSADQNLILFDDATIYNPSHLFGFFSAFNPDVVKGVELYKSVVPVKYGGRLSSVLDVSTKDGNDKKISGSGGIGLLTSKFTIEGPLKKDKTSFILGGRTTYSNWLLKTVPNSAYSNSRASFYDLNIHISHTINSKNNLYLTGYLSNDNFRFNRDTTYKYGNKNVIVKWKHIFNNKLFALISAGLDNYQYNVTSNSNPVNSYKLTYDINQNNFKADFTYRPDNRQSFSFGLNAIYYKLNPGSFLPYGNQSMVTPDVLQDEQGLESAAYLGYQHNLTSNLSLNAGIRYSMFNYLGPHDTYNYLGGSPKEVATITDTSYYGSGKIIKTYQGPEYRVSLRYALPGDASIKIGYNTLRQYIHQLSNTVSISPVDIWKLSDRNIRPQTGQQISIGFYKNLNSNNIETSLEFYYKEFKNIIDYKSGASLLLNHHIETDIINSKGKAYGVEFLIKKLSGKLNGWLSYTYSRTLLKQDDALAGETINNGDYYPASYDKPHNVNFISNYKFSHRLSLSINVVYSTGRPITLPIAVFNSNGSQRVLYSDRNEFRIPDYFRSDVSFSLDGNHRVKQALHNSWSLGVYNLSARQNAYSVYFVQENGLIKGYQLSIFGTIIPYLTYNFRF
ncbi:MAG TPA: carboxypeptidase-like regulatory domain-containing protein [Chitinophagaceae bacterium]|nr:carboxypeptidase-like regulatory domain-containing protein [Chitinophagaceae bacterium]